MDAQSVYNIIKRNGVSSIARVYADSSFSPSTNKTTRGSATDYPVYLVPPYKNVEGYKNTELITSGIGTTGIANYQLEFDIKAGLVLVINNKIWTVTSITPISNSSGIIFYSMEIESGN
jgi:hypothetical protein